MMKNRIQMISTSSSSSSFLGTLLLLPVSGEKLLILKETIYLWPCVCVFILYGYGIPGPGERKPQQREKLPKKMTNNGFAMLLLIYNVYH